MDLGEAAARVRASYTGGALGTPKNRERRDVDLITYVVDLLEGLRETHCGGTDELVFAGENGHPFISATALLRRHLYPAMAAAEIHRIGADPREADLPQVQAHVRQAGLESGAQITWLSRHVGPTRRQRVAVLAPRALLDHRLNAIFHAEKHAGAPPVCQQDSCP